MAQYIQRGKTKIFYLPSIAGANGPTVAEITAGTRIDDWIRDVNGFTFTATTVEANKMSTRQVVKIAGVDDAPDSSFVVYNDDTVTTHEVVLAKGVTGYFVFFPVGTTTAGSKCDVFPAQVISNNPVYTAAAEAATSNIGVAVTADKRSYVAVLA